MKLLDIISESVVISGANVWNHIVNITPYEDMIPHGFEKLIRPREFKYVPNYNVKALLKTDPDFKEYYRGGDEDRYEHDDEIEFDENSLKEPVVVVDGELLDGYSRSSKAIRFGDGTQDAYVAIPKEQK